MECNGPVFSASLQILADSVVNFFRGSSDKEHVASVLVPWLVRGGVVWLLCCGPFALCGVTRIVAHPAPARRATCLVSGSVSAIPVLRLLTSACVRPTADRVGTTHSAPVVLFGIAQSPDTPF